MASWYLNHRRAVIIGFIVFAAVYLTIHWLIFDKDFHFTTLTDFILKGREHIVHVAPVIIVFIWLLIKDRHERRKSSTLSP